MVIEDGSGVPLANSYLSVTACDQYHNSRGNSAWLALTDERKTQCLILAADYLQQAYRQRWKGWRVQTTQCMDWPRQGVCLEDNASQYVVPLNQIPLEVQQAQAELALRADAGPLAPDLSQAVLQESVGSLGVSYDRNSPQHTRYRAIDLLLTPFLRTVGAMHQVGRA